MEQIFEQVLSEPLKTILVLSFVVLFAFSLLPVNRIISVRFKLKWAFLHTLATAPLIFLLTLYIYSDFSPARIADFWSDKTSTNLLWVSIFVLSAGFLSFILALKYPVYDDKGSDLASNLREKGFFMIYRGELEAWRKRIRWHHVLEFMLVVVSIIGIGFVIAEVVTVEDRRKWIIVGALVAIGCFIWSYFTGLFDLLSSDNGDVGRAEE